MFNIKHVKLGTSEPAVHGAVAIPASDSSARAIVLVVRQNAILRMVAGKKVINVYSLYFLCILNKRSIFASFLLLLLFYFCILFFLVFIRVFSSRMHFSGFNERSAVNFG